MNQVVERRRPAVVESCRVAQLDDDDEDDDDDDDDDEDQEVDVGGSTDGADLRKEKVEDVAAKVVR